jgi:hypothetical protein
MDLTEIYIQIFLENFFNQKSFLTEAELDPKLKNLLTQADKLVFEKFNIDPKDKVYFIAGSAALYLFPAMRDKFELKTTIGDLDIVIPDNKYWENAGLGGESIYRPKGNNEIEVFKEWDPSKAGGQYANVNVRSTSKILNKAVYKEGYWFMSLFDIIHYKIKLDRDKEKDIISIIDKYRSSSPKEKQEFINNIISQFVK